MNAQLQTVVNKKRETKNDKKILKRKRKKEGRKVRAKINLGVKGAS